MKQTLSTVVAIVLLTLHLFLFSLDATAQTPGFIYRAATSGGARILDPNGDGYISQSRTGFQGTNDLGTASEIPYRALPMLEAEVLGDVNTSSTGGHTDFVPPIPVQAYFDGTHLLLRMRLGSQSTASKGYSILIDSNNTFSGTGTNPGFEYEVLLASNFDVRVINHGAAGSPVIFSGAETQYSQRAIAATTNSNNADYFYDFYVPLSAFNGGITASTPLRVAGITITSAQSGITGTVSDVSGVNFQAYGFNPQAAWREVITNFPPLSLNDLRNGTLPSACPRINTPLFTGATTITGTTTETSGTTTIRVYNGTTQIGSTTITNASSFTVPVSPALAAGASIAVTAQATGKTESSRTCNVTTVLAECSRPPAPTLSIGTNRSNAVITATTTYPSVTFRLYQVTSTATAYTPTLYSSVTVTNSSTGTILPTGGSNKIPDGEFFATIVVNGCESGRSNYVCNRGTQTASPTITSSLTPSATQVSGTAVSGALVILIVNGIQQGNAVTATGGNFTFNLQQPLTPGQQVFVRSFIPEQCSNVSTTQTVTTVATAPTITGTYCGPTTVVSGTSTEPAGTTIQVYSNGTAVSPTTTVNQYGYWTVTLSTAIPVGNTITARASNLPGRTLSPPSQPVTVAQQTANTGLTINPITEGSTTITGRAPAGSQVTLYIEGTAFTPVTADASGNWTVTGISALEVFAGASVTATAKAANQCESARITPVIVTCMAPSTAPTIAPTATTICSGGTAQVTIGNSENGISYRLLNGTTETGSSVLGTGGTIILESGPLTAAATLRVRARKISGTTCDILLPGQVQVSINPLPPSNYTVTISSSTGCAGLSTPVITVAGTQTGFSYQLINDATKQPVTTTDSNTKAGTGGAITFTVSSVSATTTYGIRVTNTTQATSCSTENQNKVTYTVTGPATNQPVTISRSVICPGGSAIVSVTTNNDNYTYQLVRASDNTNVGSSFTGTGQVQTITVSPTTTTTYFVRVTGAGCTVALQNRVTLEVSSTGVTVTAGENRTICDNTVTLTGTDPTPSTGTWTISSKPTTNTTAAFSNASSPTTTVTGLTSGTYVFTWTINTSCAGAASKASANVTIIVNCPATYNVAPPRYINQYSLNSLLASATDPDGGIGSATLVSGSGILPPGTELLANGDIRVSSVSALRAGTYTFDVITRDLQGIDTRHTLTIRIYGNEPTVVPLPVELVYFRAVLRNNVAELEWLTASEINNKHFEVQRSADGKTFKQIAIVNGKGTSSIATKYTYTDTSPAAGITYYRLKQVDFDGEFAYSRVVYVRNESTANGKNLLVYPNPFVTDLNMTILAEGTGEAVLQIFDLQGRVFHSSTLQLNSGTNQFNLPLQFLSKGIYILRIDGNGISESVKILKR